MGRPVINVVGQRFSRIVVLSVTRGGNHTLCECKCDCGVIFTTRKHRLVNGSTKSCGCFRLEVVKYGEHHKRQRREGTAFRRLLYQYKANAKTRGLEWGLTEEQFRELTSSPCYYTGFVPEKPQDSRNKNEVYVYNGIDRVDNTKGYTITNCVPCCFEINAMKRDFSEQRFIELCAKVAERFNHEFTDYKCGPV